MANVANITLSLILAYSLCTNILHLTQPNKVCCSDLHAFYKFCYWTMKKASATVNICILIKL